MQKLDFKAIIFTSTVFLSVSTAYAGTMGNAQDAMPYLGGEASYSWRQTDPIQLNTINNQTSDQGWGGRLSAGMLKFYTPNIGLTGEIGGGYYGSTTITKPEISSKVTFSVDGYDALVGALYRLQYLDIFAKIGFMIENSRSSINRQNLSQLYNGDLINGSSYTRSNRTQVLPEIRVGGIYNLRNNLGITLTYLHAFGSTMSGIENISANVASGVDVTKSIKEQNPTLNSILFGLRYYMFNA
ncbi:MAG: hypothetical protein NXI01_02715 [Gammaproteobacteria bacterium]|nr:hypothetical protein [Gammaproteobacteria bacterium]